MSARTVGIWALSMINGAGGFILQAHMKNRIISSDLKRVLPLSRIAEQDALFHPALLDDLLELRGDVLKRHPLREVEGQVFGE